MQFALIGKPLKIEVGIFTGELLQGFGERRVVGLIFRDDLNGQQRCTQCTCTGNRHGIPKNIADLDIGHSADKSDVASLENTRVLKLI